MGPDFPVWLRTKIWKLASSIERIYLKDNQIIGNISNVWLNSSVIHLNSNRFQGELPVLSRNVAVLNIANNSLSGLIPSLLCKYMHRDNNVLILDMSNNLLSSELSHCWMYWQK